MADTRAFTYKINPVGSGEGEDNAVHQVSPAWVMTFVRWENRDTQRNSSVPSTSVREPLVVENDCLQVTVTVNKGVLTPSFNAILVMTDVNYETSVAPGDFVFINMLNWQSEARAVATKARNKQAINGVKDGFKGIFKVQGVRRVVSTDPNSGAKTVLFKINGFGFTEFNNTIYFNPFLVDSNQDPKNQLLFASFIGKDWANLINSKGLTNCQDIIAVLIQSFIGNGIGDQGRLEKNGTVKSPNVHFFVPELVGSLLGVRGAKAAKDVYNYIFGVQKYAAGSGTSLADGMNPANMSLKFGRFYYTSTPCPGDSLLKPEYWNQVKTWSILNQYTNTPINEIYTCYKVTPTNKIMPTLVFRQIPFTTEDYSGPGAVTKFMNLPRWKVDSALILDQDIGREEAARINFVQYFGKSTVGINGSDISQEIAQGNYVYDINDVQRSGLRPYIVTTQFDEPTTTNKEYRSPTWAKILGDCVIGGHLKMNGTINCAGLVDPIAVGDNLELDDVVYHIEQVTHSCTINVQDGKKMFRTVISLSSGMHISSSTKGTRYSEMDYTNAEDLRKNDFNNDEILPGVSEAQDTVYRPDTVDGPFTPNKPFPQPGASLPKTTKRKAKK
jgi:hypothetical protein